MRVRNSAVIAVFALAMFAGGLLLSRGVPGRIIPVDHARLLESVMERLENDYIDSLDRPGLYNLAMEGMLRRLGDPHAAYLPPARFALLRERMSGTHVGPGVEIDSRSGYIVVVTPYAGSPAERAGVRPGDRVVDVNGRRTDGMSVDEVRIALQGSAGTSVNLGVERLGMAERLSFELARRPLAQRSVGAAFMLSAEAGYVRLDRFAETSANEVRESVDSLLRQPLNALVLDLRGNPGGLLDEGVAVADLFLDENDTIVTTRGREADDVQFYVDRSSQRWPDLELILLVDGGSASATEVVAGALQDHDRALLLGMTTYGKGSAQSIFELATGGALKLTTARWYTPLGRSIEAATDSRMGPAPAATAPQRARPEYRTPAGRRVLGGGGVVPDVRVAAGPAGGEDARAEEASSRIDSRDRAMRDPAVRTALTLASGASSQADLFERAAAFADTAVEAELRP